MAKKKSDSFQEDSLEKNSLKKKNIFRHKFFYIVIIFLLVLILTFFAAYLASLEPKSEEISKCGDGTFYETCSLDKPFYCEEGILTEKASLCGCESPESFNFKKDGDFCVPNQGTSSKDVPLKYLLEGEIHRFNYTVYEEVNEYVSNVTREIVYESDEIPFRTNFKLLSVNEEVQRAMLMPLVKKIQNLAPDSKTDQARIALSIVQNIPYGSSNKTFSFGDEEVDYSRYPYEILFENQGICGEKSELASFLLKELGFGVSIFYFVEENHEAVGIKCPVKESLYGTGFCFVETGGPSIISDHEMEFIGGIKLESVPEVMIISEGISLPENMKEYRDAQTLKQIRDRSFIGILKSWRYDNIRERYGLDGDYELN
ncbi:MAG: hypothetical protein WDZ62_00680 [Candidatus Pacearchaeota archaeon]